MSAVSGYSVAHDPEVQQYRRMRAAVLAREQQRKQEQRERRRMLGLPEIKDERGLISRVLGLGKGKKERKEEGKDMLEVKEREVEGWSDAETEVEVVVGGNEKEHARKER